MDGGEPALPVGRDRCRSGARGANRREGGGRRRARVAEAERSLADEAKTAGALDDPPALETVASVFGLTAFERAVLVLCAGVELEAGLARLCGTGPTFGLALGSLPGAHWSAAAPGAPLRRWRLVEVGAGATLMSSPLADQ